MKTIGVTGGIGSGKSTFCGFLSDLGAVVFDSDAQAKRLMVEDAELRDAITTEFGSQAYATDGSLERDYLASQVFGDSDRLSVLNGLVHPKVHAAFADFRQEAERSGVSLVVRESAIMPEAHERAGLDLLVALSASAALRLERVASRDGTTEQAVSRRMGHQASDAVYASHADRVIENGGGLAELKQAAGELFEELHRETLAPAGQHPYPDLPPDLPRWGNGFLRLVGRLGLGLAGYRITGTFPNLKKFVLVGAPHTSNWDFVLGMLFLAALGLRVNWVGKHTIFRWPFGPFMRWLGGLPVDRNRADGLVAQVGEAIRTADSMAVGLAPEGTRKKVDRWKTGFYRIALDAGVPIVIGMLDYGNRELRVDSVFHPTGDMEADIRAIRERYRGVRGRNPDQS
ncbi:MAG: dephospho-CoA kinase [Rhodothermales bacterium]|jgi:dephospho-CoA kinase